jgi:hypothetical protein
MIYTSQGYAKQRATSLNHHISTGLKASPWRHNWTFPIEAHWSQNCEILVDGNYQSTRKLAWFANHLTHYIHGQNEPFLSYHVAIISSQRYRTDTPETTLDKNLHALDRVKSAAQRIQINFSIDARLLVYIMVSRMVFDHNNHSMEKKREKREAQSKAKQN